MACMLRRLVGLGMVLAFLSGKFLAAQNTEIRLPKRLVPDHILQSPFRDEWGRTRVRFFKMRDGGETEYVLVRNTQSGAEWVFDPTGHLVGRTKPVIPDSIPPLPMARILNLLESGFDSYTVKKVRVRVFNNETQFLLEVMGIQSRQRFLVFFRFDGSGSLLEEEAVGASGYDISF